MFSNHFRLPAVISLKVPVFAATVFTVAMTLLALGPRAHAQELNVVSWDGAYVRSQVLALIRPYEAATGVDVNLLHYSGGLDEIRRQVRSLNVRWDVVDLQLFDAINACEDGLLERIDHAAVLESSPDGTPVVEDFIDDTLMPCGVGNIVSSTVIGYNSARLDQRPTSIEDFFNIKKFPGRRALRRTPQVNLEWALIADGVDPNRVYEVLATDKGVDRAFRVLSKLKPYIDWWRDGADPVRWLENGEVVMASVFSGRISDEAQSAEALKILWDHQMLLYDVWAIPKNSPRKERALDFIRFVSRPERMAEQVQYIPYGPTRHSALRQVPEDRRARLPTARANMATAVKLNERWWSNNLERLNRRFERWLERPVMVPRELPR